MAFRYYDPEKIVHGKKMKDWFKLNGELQGSSKLVVGILGFVFSILLWYILAELFSKKRPIYEGGNDAPMELIDSTGKEKIRLWD